MKVNMSQYFNDIYFVEDSHRYYYGGQVIPVSASVIYKMFTSPFEKDLIAGKVAKRDGRNKKDVIKEWEEKAHRACVLGTQTHSFGEAYMQDRSIKPSNLYEIALKSFIDKIPDYVTLVSCEKIMYHYQLDYAGTADLILYNEKTDKYIIVDYKSNENLFKCYGDKKMVYPFEQLLDMPYNHYQIQLSLYQMLLEQIPGVEVGIRRLVWLLPDGNFKILDTADYCEALLKEMSVSD
jgi:hypothetical protein